MDWIVDSDRSLFIEMNWRVTGTFFCWNGVVFAGVETIVKVLWCQSLGCYSDAGH